MFFISIQQYGICGIDDSIIIVCDFFNADLSKETANHFLLATNEAIHLQSGVANMCRIILNKVSLKSCILRIKYNRVGIPLPSYDQKAKCWNNGYKVCMNKSHDNQKKHYTL